jgi:hypothetical protein
MSFARRAGADCGSVTMPASTNTITRISDFIFGLLFDNQDRCGHPTRCRQIHRISARLAKK